jgi:hypothetical protein
MDEQKKEQESEEPQKIIEQKKEEPQKSDSIATKSPIEEARFLAERIEKGNEEFKSLIERNEKLLVEARLEGHGLAGQGNIQIKKPEVSDVEYAKALQRGEIL